MANGNFSNGGIDTFNANKQYIGVRLQRGVPLLDRDWNEAEDVRRYFENSLRQRYIGNGVPGRTDFQIVPAPPGTDFDFTVSPGRCMVGGYDIWNPAPLLFSQQTGAAKLPATTTADSFQVYVTPSIQRITSAQDSALANAQDINLETCVRDRLTWLVSVVRAPELAPAGSLLLATIKRPAGATYIDASMITDMRGPQLNLRRLAEAQDALTARVTALEGKVLDLQVAMDNANKLLARLFWQVNVGNATPFYLWGDKATISIRVVDGLNNPVVNCFLDCSTTSGWLSATGVNTDANGQATISLTFVETVAEPDPSEVGILHNTVLKVQRATLSNPGSVQYSQVLLEPKELSTVSKYTAIANYQNLSVDVPAAAIIRPPRLSAATVTVQAKDADQGVVRGTGSIRIPWGEWVRDWALTKLYEVSQATDVGVRVGDLMRGAVQATGFDANGAQTALNNLYDQAHTDTVNALKSHLFVTPSVADADLAQSGILAQTIADEATTAIGTKVSDALNTQFTNIAGDATVSAASKTALASAKVAIVQSSSVASAGMAQRGRQFLNSQRAK